MAEYVELNIEKTLPVLQQLERESLFKKDEIKLIIKQRRALEYLLKRSTKSKADYLKYIQYEVNLLGLLKVRRVKMGNFNKRTEIDNFIVQGINKLFKMAVLRFQDDIDLWLAHISFLKKVHWTGSISKMFGRMLQVHNKAPKIWIHASKYEFEENNSPESARKLMQRGLRFNAESKELWLEYFKLELLFAEKMRNRREVLGIEEVEKNADAIDDDVLNGKIAVVVFENAIKEINDVPFKAEFLQTVSRFSFTEVVEDEIYKCIEEEHKGTEEGLDMIIRRPFLRIYDITQNSITQKILSEKTIYELERSAFLAYDNAVAEINSVKMWSKYIQFCLNRLTESGTEKHAALILNHLLELFSKASEGDKLKPEDFRLWIQLLEECQELGKINIVVDIGISRYPNDVILWMKQLELGVQAKMNKEKISELFQAALKHVADKDSISIWQLYSNWAITETPETAKSVLEKAILTCRKKNLHFQYLLLDWSETQSGIASVEKTYEWIKNHVPVTPEVINRMISLEIDKGKSNIVKIRNYYEAGIHEFGSSNIQIWIDYISHELSHEDGNKMAGGKIYWRAIKTLQPQLTDMFIASHSTVTR